MGGEAQGESTSPPFQVAFISDHQGPGIEMRNPGSDGLGGDDTTIYRAVGSSQVPGFNLEHHATGSSTSSCKECSYRSYR